jgi:hypothetical protein
MKTKTKILLLIISLSVLIASCSKEEGEGGTSSITGKIYVINYNAEFTDIKDSGYAQEENVYIIYGDNEVYDDDFDTNYDGTYLFQHLRKGDYTIFVYSKNLNPPHTPKTPVMGKVSITENHQEVELEDIVIYN